MKKLCVMLIVLAAVCCTYGCEPTPAVPQVSSASQTPPVSQAVPTAAPQAEPVETEYTVAQKNVTFTNTILSEGWVDLSAVNNGYAYADTVVIGTVNTVSLAQYKQSGRIPTSEVSFSCEKTLKGTAAGNITFLLSGGYLTMAQYAEHNDFADKENPESRPTDGYAQVKIDNRPSLTEGERYMIFLADGYDGSFRAIGSDYFALSVKDKIMTDFEGKEYTQEEITKPLPLETLEDWPTMYIYQYSGQALGWEYTIKDSDRISRILAIINAPTMNAQSQGNPDGGTPIQIAHAKGEDNVYYVRTYGGMQGSCSDISRNGIWYSAEVDDYDQIEKLAKGQ